MNHTAQRALKESEGFIPDAFPRKLHTIYSSATRLGNKLVYRVRTSFMALVICIAFAGCLGLGHDRSSIYQLFSLCVGIFISGVVWTLLRKGSVRSKREMPRFGTVGEPLRYSVQVWNERKSRLVHAWLSETVPDHCPSLADFCLLREPIEAKRNAFDRKFAYYRWKWIMMHNRPFIGGTSYDVIQLKGGESMKVSIEITPLRRGVTRLDDLRLLLPDPFGIFQCCKKVAAPPATLTVLPRRFPLPKIELPGGSALKMSGEASSNTIGSSGDFLGLRDYRPGDPLRQVHWKSWARLGRPMVKELEDNFYPRYGLVVDTFSVGQMDEHFEEVISVAASFAAGIDTTECLLDLMFIKDEAHTITAGRNVERADKLLEVLAGVSPERTMHYDQLAQLVTRYRDDLASCLVILNGWDEAKSEFLGKLQSQGILCAILIVGSGARPAGVPGHWLESGKVAQDLMRLPQKLSTLT